MFIKLGIIVGIVILGGMIFSNEIGNFFPTTSTTVLDSLKNDLSIFASKISDSLEQKIDSPISIVANKTNELVSNELSDAGDIVSNELSDAGDIVSNELSDAGDIVSNELSDAGDIVSNEISEAKKSSQKIIGEDISNFNPIELIQNIFTD